MRIVLLAQTLNNVNTPKMLTFVFYSVPFSFPLKTFFASRKFRMSADTGNCHTKISNAFTLSDINYFAIVTDYC